MPLFFEIFVPSTVIAFCLVGLGQSVLSSTGFQNVEASYCILVALTPLLVVLWYMQDVVTWRYIILAYAIAAVAFVSWSLVRGSTTPKWRANCASTLGVRALEVLPTLLIVVGAYVILTSGSAISFHFNNDFFNWFIVSGTLVGTGNYLHTSPDAAISWPAIKADAFGTSWIVALLSLLDTPGIRTAPVFLTLASSFIALAIQAALRGLFQIKSLPAVLASLCVIGSTFFIYVVFNGFFAQLLATLGAIVWISASFREVSNEPSGLVSKTAFCSIPALFIFCVYQSGYLVFSALVIGFTLLTAMAPPIVDGHSIRPKNYRITLAIPTLLSSLAPFLIMPELGLQVVERTLVVSVASAGWPLPRVPANVFLFLPWIGQAPLWMLSAQDGALSGFVIAAVAVTTLMASYVRRLHLQGPATIEHSVATRLILGWVWYGLLVAVYLIWVGIKEPTYQHWKFASFFNFSLAIVPLATIIKTLPMLARIEGIRSLRLFKYSVYAVALTLLCLSPLFGSVELLKKLNSLDSKSKQLQMLNRLISPGSMIVLDLDPLHASMLPMAILSAKGELVPLSPTYLPAARVVPPLRKNQQGWLLTTRICDTLIDRINGSSASKSVVHTDDYAMRPLVDLRVGTYSFAGGGGACALGRGIAPVFGFSGPEPWGTWSEGTQAQIRVDLPIALRGEIIELLISGTPFLTSGVNHQRVLIMSEGQTVFEGSLNAFTTIKLIIPASAVIQTSLNIHFMFPDAVSPHSIDSRNSDPRLLAFGFKELTLRLVKQVQPN